jgi:transposase
MASSYYSDTGESTEHGIRMSSKRDLERTEISPPLAVQTRVEQGGQALEALGRSRGGFTTKLHLRVDGHGKPLVMLLTPGERHDSQALVPLLEAGAIKRMGRGRPRSRPKRVVGDKSYNSQPIRHYLQRRGIAAVIPRRSNQRHAPQFDRATYRQRNVVERVINRLKQFRRVATRYEKRAANYLAMVTLAAIVWWVG